MATTYDIDIKLNVDDSELEKVSSDLQNLEQDFQKATAEVERLEEALMEAELNGDDIEADYLADELAFAREEAERLEETLNNSSEAADNASQSYQDAGASASAAGDEMAGMGDKSQEGANQVEDAANNTSDAMSSLGDAMGGLAAGLALENMVDTAGRIEDSWTRLDITFGGVTNEMRSSIDAAANATGRSGSSIRGYYNAMGIAGIKNSDLLNQSFQSISGRAFQTGADINQLTSLVEKMALSGNAGARQLTMLGISTDDLGAAMGVTGEEASKAFKNLSQEERLDALTRAMGDGKEANEEYKNSWEGVKDQAETALSGLMGAVGSTILPIVVPALDMVKDGINTLKDVFKSLPDSVQGFIGVIGGGTLAAVALSGAIGVISSVIGVIGGISLPFVAIAAGIAAIVYGFEQFGEYMGWWTDFGSMLSSVKDGVIRLWEAFTGSEIVQLQIKRIQGLFEFLKPILSWIGDKFMSLFGDPGSNVDAVGAIIDAFTTVDHIMATVGEAWDFFAGQAFDALMMIVTPIWNILSAWQGVYSGETSIFDAIGATLQNLVTLHTNILGLLFNFVSTIFNSLFTMITGALARLGGAIQTRLMVMVNIARLRATAFVNAVVNGIKSLPSKFLSALGGVVTAVGTWGSQLLNKAQEVVTAFVNKVKDLIPAPLRDLAGLTGASFEGVSYSGVGYSGFNTGNTLNRTISTSASSNNSSNTVNLNLSGIIDKDASTYIVDAVNDHVKKNNLIRGV